MPQLDTSTWPPQLFWLAISFALLYFVVSRVAIPRTGGVIAMRKSMIAKDLADAVAHKAASEAALKAYEASLADARGKANAASLEARNKAGGEADAARHHLDGVLSAKAAAADKAVQAAKEKAISGLSGVAEELALTIVAQFTDVKVTKSTIAAAVAKALK